MVMVCFSAIIERKPPWAGGVHASLNKWLHQTAAALFL
jgi:hypothetical protein